MPPLVLMRCTLVTPYNPPSPRWLVTSSLSHRMSFGVAPGELATAFGGHRTPVREFPNWSRVMTASCLSIEEKGGDRLASLPNQLRVRADLAFIDLSALRMERRNDVLAGDSDCRWYLRINCSRKQRSESNKREQRHF